VRILYSFNCEHARLLPDQYLDAHHIFHQLGAPGFPALHTMYLVVGMEWDTEPPGPVDFKIDLIDPDSSPVLTITGQAEVGKSEPGKAPQVSILLMPMQDVVFPKAGTYHFALQVGDRKDPLAPLHLIEAADL
jgi:hypothetical protein